jgi:hypothetical protein
MGMQRQHKGSATLTLPPIDRSGKVEPPHLAPSTACAAPVHQPGGQQAPGGAAAPLASRGSGDAGTAAAASVPPAGAAAKNRFGKAAKQRLRLVDAGAVLAAYAAEVEAAAPGCPVAQGGDEGAVSVSSSRLTTGHFLEMLLLLTSKR